MPAPVEFSRKIYARRDCLQSREGPHFICLFPAECYRVQGKSAQSRTVTMRTGRSGLRSPKSRKPASTQDVLGPQVTQQPVPAKWKSHYQRLEQLRERLLVKKGDLAEDARQEMPSFSMHMADAGTDTYDRDWALSMLSSEQNAVYEIEAAMERIRNGTYGKCELTGKSIERERLEAIPWTRFSADAERELENNGMADRARLGQLGSAAAVSRSAEKETDFEEEKS